MRRNMDSKHGKHAQMNAQKHEQMNENKSNKYLKLLAVRMGNSIKSCELKNISHTAEMREPIVSQIKYRDVLLIVVCILRVLLNNVLN